jgi:hypothetical protein
LAASLYDFGDVRWKAPRCLGFSLDISNDGVSIFSQEGRLSLDEIPLSFREDGAAVCHGYPYPLNLLQALLV